MDNVFNKRKKLTAEEKQELAIRKGMEKLRSYLNGLTPENQRAFAIRCETSVGYLRKAISEAELINPKTCVKIEQESANAVTRKDLHPNDWEATWPELAIAA
jgi:hypothetical protein